MFFSFAWLRECWSRTDAKARFSNKQKHGWISKIHELVDRFQENKTFSRLLCDHSFCKFVVLSMVVSQVEEVRQNPQESCTQKKKAKYYTFLIYCRKNNAALFCEKRFRTKEFKFTKASLFAFCFFFRSDHCKVVVPSFRQKSGLFCWRAFFCLPACCPMVPQKVYQTTFHCHSWRHVFLVSWSFIDWFSWFFLLCFYNTALASSRKNKRDVSVQWKKINVVRLNFLLHQTLSSTCVRSSVFLFGFGTMPQSSCALASYHSRSGFKLTNNAKRTKKTKITCYCQQVICGLAKRLQSCTVITNGRSLMEPKNTLKEKYIPYHGISNRLLWKQRKTCQITFSMVVRLEVH